MTDRAEELPPVVKSALSRLHARALGIASGTALSLLVMSATVILLVRAEEPVGPRLALLGEYFIGYTVSWPGVAVGGLWGFGLGFACGWLFAVARNSAVRLWVEVIRGRAEMRHYKDLLDHL